MSIQMARQPPINNSLEPSNHPYLIGPWTPLLEEADVEELEITHWHQWGRLRSAQLRLDGSGH